MGDALTFVILSDDGMILNRSVIRSASGKPLAGFLNLRLNHTQYEGTPPEPLPTLITLKAAPAAENTNQMSVTNAEADIPGQVPDADIPASNTDGLVNPSQDKGGIGVEQTSPSETSTASKLQKTTQKSLSVKNQKKKQGPKVTNHEPSNQKENTGVKFSSKPVIISKNREQDRK